MKKIPRSPFATRLSGSAREIELRIRSIFQWKKQRPPLALFLLMLVIGLLSTLPYSKQLPPSRVLMPAGFAANHPLLPFNTALQYGIVIAVLESAGVAANVNLVKFSLVNLCLSIGFLVWCILAYKIGRASCRERV